MKIKIDGRDYSFKFYHENPPTYMIFTNSKGEEVAVKIIPTPERATTCRVFNEEGKQVTYGVSNVHPKDNFCKEKGRQIALSRAISKWDKSYRTQVWNEYRTWGAKDRW